MWNCIELDFLMVSRFPWDVSGAMEATAIMQGVTGKLCHFEEEKGAVLTGEAFSWR